jgi:hypothetical protein
MKIIFFLLIILTGSLAKAQACTDDVLNAAACDTAASRYVSPVNGGNQTGGSGNLSLTVPVGFYDGTETATASDGDLIQANIRNSTDIFGTVGNLDEAFALCTDDVSNPAQCSTALGRYVTGTLGGAVNGVAGSITATIPTGYQDGTNMVSVSDADLAAGNIRNGTNIFGTAGSVDEAFSACSDNSLNASQCSTALGRYVTGTLGNAVSGAAGSLTVTIPTGFQNGTKIVSVNDADLVAANIRNGTNIFGVSGLTNEAFSGCTDDNLNVSQCSTVAGRYVTATAPAGVNGTAGSLTATIPTGYQDGTKAVSINDADLVATNIRNTINIFGVSGSINEAFAACSDDVSNASQCSTAASRYVTSTLGGAVNGADGNLVVAITTGFYDGTISASVSDTDLVAANIRSGVNLFGVNGTYNALYAGCTDNSLNNSACTTATNRYVTGTSGGNVSLTASTSATIPAGYYSSKTCSVGDADLVAGNIRYGVTILGVTGTYGPSDVYSTMYRSPSQTPKSLYTETVSEAGSAYPNSATGYRAVPKSTTDNDGYYNLTKVNRTGWTGITCGLSGTTAARIADCAATLGAETTWDGVTKGNAAQGVWKLVTRFGNEVNPGTANVRGREVWQDQRTGLLWSSRVTSSTNWCKASGHNFITNNPAAEDDPNNYCDNAANQNTGTGPATKAISFCYEDGNNYFRGTDNISSSGDLGGKGGLGWGTTPFVAWRLPTHADYFEADKNGIRFVLPDNTDLNDYEWTASMYGSTTTGAILFNSQYGGIEVIDRNLTAAVRCVGR